MKHCEASSAALALPAWLVVLTAAGLALLPTGALGASITNNTIGDFGHSTNGDALPSLTAWHTCPAAFSNSTVGYSDLSGGGAPSEIPYSFASDPPRLAATTTVWAAWSGSSGRGIVSCNLMDPLLTIITVSPFLSGVDQYAPAISTTGLVAWVWEAPDSTRVAYSWLGSGTVIMGLGNPPGSSPRPRVWGTWIVYQIWDGTDWEIMAFDAVNAIIHQLTDNAFDDVAPEISQGLVVWSGWDGTDWEIFLNVGDMTPMGTIPITDNAADDRAPVVTSPDGLSARIAWEQWDGTDWEIWWYDQASGGMPQAVTDNSGNDHGPAMSGNRLCWYGWDGEDWEVYCAEAPLFSPVHPVTTNALWDQRPSIQGNLIVWEQYDGADYEMMMADASTLGVPPAAGGDLALSPWSPNPSRGLASVSFTLARPSRVEMTVFDASGRRVATPANGVYGEGRHSITWAGRDAGGALVPPGIYLTRLKAGDVTRNGRLLILR